jgi:hypothetical protein
VEVDRPRQPARDLGVAVMTGVSGEQPVTSLLAVVNSFTEVSPETRARMYEALVNREEQMAGVLHLAGQQFGLFPQIVAEVLAEVGMGAPKTTEERVMIHSSFHILMEQIAAAQRGEGPMPQP